MVTAAAFERPALCDRPGADVVRDLLCGATLPEISGLYDLELALGLQTKLKTEGVTYHNKPILLSHSTSLSRHLTSAINPRAFFVGDELVLGFQRGAQHAEVAARDRARDRFNLYLFRFEQDCNTSAEGCSNADLFTPRIERNWTTLTVEDDEDLKNTPLDCRQCHQRGRPEPGLLMRELQSPWTHFFDSIPASSGASPGVRGSDLLQDYLDAHGAEKYAEIDVANYPAIAPFALESIIDRNHELVFDTRLIEQERWPEQPNGDSLTPLPSPTWERAYESFKRGEQLALPYVEVRVADPAKQASLTAAYRGYLRGETRDELPELSDIFPDDLQVRARIGLNTEPDASPVEALIQACAPCHNSVLDQSLSRARFNVDLSRLDPAELELAAERIERGSGEQGVMPPPEARQLTAATRARLLGYLRVPGARKRDPVPELVQASAYGMARAGF